MTGYVPLKDRLGRKGTHIAAVVACVIAIPVTVLFVFVAVPNLLAGAQ